MAQRLPFFVLQFFFTWLTGKAAPGQRLARHGVWTPVALAAGTLLLGEALIASSLASGSTFVLVPATLAVVAAARYLQLVVVHAAAHDSVAQRRSVNRLLGCLFSTVLLIEPFDRYRVRHCTVHHAPRSLSTLRDPTVEFLRTLGIRPGMTPASMWRKLGVALVSPWFHSKVFAGRVASQFRAGGPQGLVSGLYLGALVFAAASPAARPYVVAMWVLPLVWLYQASSAVRLIVEHRWATRGTRPATARELILALTPALFLGSPPPPPRLTALAAAGAWLGWGARTCADVLVRLLVVPGASGPAHDHHHLEPRGDFVNYVEAREAYRDRARARGESFAYTETWGLVAAIDANFRSFADGDLE